MTAFLLPCRGGGIPIESIILLMLHMRRDENNQMVIYTDTFAVERKEEKIVGDVFATKANCVICQADLLDDVYENKLASLGFRFLDRRLYFEIQTSGFGMAYSNDTLPDIEFICDSEFDDRLVELACKAYVTDRRFHLGPIFDQSKPRINKFT